MYAGLLSLPFTHESSGKFYEKTGQKFNGLLLASSFESERRKLRRLSVAISTISAV